MVAWTNQEFDIACHQLCRAFKEVTVPVNNDHRYHYELVQWEIHHHSVQELAYLVHRPLKVPLCNRGLRRQPQSPRCLTLPVKGEDDLVDSTISYDADLSTVWNSITGGGSFLPTEYRLSIVFSETWQVPVMYFVLLHADGTTWTRDQVVAHLIERNDCSTIMEDSWNFVSFDEHPVTRVPALFLHPCQTGEWLHLSGAGAAYPAQRLWSWMSMVFSTLGFPIQSKMYRRVLEMLPSSGSKIDNERSVHSQVKQSDPKLAPG